MAAKDDVGRAGERLAEDFLTDEGYVVLARNWRGTRGELDFVAVDGSTLVAVEVKTRSSTRFGHPAEAVTPRKIARLKRLTGQWLAEHAGTLRVRFADIRIDVVAVTLPRGSSAAIELLRGVS
jgi:putative endonuclease